ncbi:hypothetical protein BT63DRAFT_412336 [Microthyrium microscopicum]|uniref:Uncharacterized protein n=1 Tax=Microthyrium microscopicum TaxID=703497 RepID=A0A6A6UIJ2_9PEZI|nr:hypothetical protein BT63DRAFT_412336 [Microthyrium microscopicum]
MQGHKVPFTEPDSIELPHRNEVLHGCPELFQPDAQQKVKQSDNQVTILPPNTATQFRSARVDECTWEKYKVDIVREFTAGGQRGRGVAQALQWIRTDDETRAEDFLPTRAQLSRKIKKWTDMQAAAELLRNDSQSEDRHDRQEVEHQDSHEDESQNKERQERHEAEHQDGPEDEPENRHEVESGPECSIETRGNENYQPTWDEDIELVLGLEYPEPDVLLGKRKSPEASPEDYPTAKKHKINDQLVLNDTKPQLDANASFDRPALQKRIAAILHEIGITYDHNWHDWVQKTLSCRWALTEQYVFDFGTRPIFSDLHSNIIRQTADYFLCSSSSNHAFPLYVLLWCSEGDSFNHKDINLLIRAYYVASNTEDQNIIKRLLAALKTFSSNQRISRQNRSHRWSQDFLYALSINESTSHSLEDYKSPNKEAPMVLIDKLNELLEIVKQPYDTGDADRGLNLQSQYIVAMILKRAQIDQVDDTDYVGPAFPNGRNGRREITQRALEYYGYMSAEIISKVPGPFEVRSPSPLGIMGSIISPSLHQPWLRKSLQWCKLCVENTFNMPMEWEVLLAKQKHNPDVLSTINSSGLFFLLWTKWIDSRQKKGSLAAKIECQASSGISETEVFKVMAYLLLSKDVTRRIRSDHDILVHKGHRILNQAREGAKFLLDLPDKQLTDMFLSQFCVLSVSKESTKRLEASICLDLFRSHVHDLSRHSQAEPNPETKYIPTRRDTYALSIISVSPTLASTLSSSTLSTLRRLALRQSQATVNSLFSRISWPSRSTISIDRLPDEMSLLTTDNRSLAEHSNNFYG